MAMEYFAQLKLRHCTKVIQLDGTTFRVKPPAYAGTVLCEHSGLQLLDSEQVKLLGVRTRLFELDAQRRAWSGVLHVGARERLKSLMLTRRSTFDLTFPTAPASPVASDDGEPVQLRRPSQGMAAASQGEVVAFLLIRLLEKTSTEKKERERG
ncbi:hypothetical protein QYE76_033265 [Lolium multiflorum]|uniref:Uncharacterized protein n=1 Tax=Lolium multiflorum TaxID=4521 RepID=A0AAD8QVS7_LOLMU|nr:hypothetical protein QYE76_033265 [Lolium multiflorum]